MTQSQEDKKECNYYPGTCPCQCAQFERLVKERDNLRNALKEIREQFELLGWD